MSRYVLLLLAAFTMLTITTEGIRICPLNEQWNECGTACPLTCENPEPRDCTQQCVKGCQCKPGWVRSKLGLCVPKKWCRAPGGNRCPPNEDWDVCGTACPLTCENPKPRICTLECVTGCQCKPGLLRNESGECVPKESCPPDRGNHCPPNEDWNECGTACPSTCKNPGPRVCTLQCVKGCQCKPGLLRNESGDCVPKESCPADGDDRCPPNEDWNECGTACPSTCKNPGPRICTLQCVKGCQCKPGLLRNESGECVPKESCPADGGDRCPPNEDWNECGTACPSTCKNPGPRICTLQCVKGCQCKPGLLRNESGDCVPKESCPADGDDRCPPNEDWNECGTACPSTCKNPGPRICTLQCVKGCQCKPGLLRNESGECVPKESCPADGGDRCPPNEDWKECGTACPSTCKNPGPRICTLQCVKGCQCKPGLLRNESGECVPKESCPPDRGNHCPPNEDWNECGTACPSTCKNPGPRVCTLQCVKGCQCKPGLLRNESGDCVPKESCPADEDDRCPPNEDWNECGTACPSTCKNPGPRICTLQCVKGCQCKPGLLRNESGDCVPKESCPADGDDRCPPNEDWNECGTACPSTCKNPGPRICTLQCVKGCQCKPGLLRNESGECVPKESCPADGGDRCPPNEDWNECGTACPSTCKNPEPKICTLQCVKGCQCKPGLLRNESGECVPKESCPADGGPRICPLNEEWKECGSACPLTCDNPEPGVCTKQCVSGCQCKPGWVRSKLGMCVPKELCPADGGPRICPLNEEWNECGTACPLTCENPEPGVCTKQCVRGCQCKPGWVRSKWGICVPKKLCPADGGPRICPLNEEWKECGSACPLTCDNPEPGVCTKQCVSGCQCKPGWVRSKLGMCVPKELCPADGGPRICPLNEEWKECGSACPLTCDNPEPGVCTKQCVRGCQCQPGWVRSKLGLCVPKQWCPPAGGNRCPPNEDWSLCGTACPLTCKNSKPRICTLPCVIGCQCKPGLLRNESGDCVPKESCPADGPESCSPHEEWNDCGTACPLTCENPEPRVCTKECVRGCQCKPGLLRNKFGRCVPKKWCC
ncbi:zonadhesin-like isoform X2 [Halictus rubicundus]|uniref:zonadhesin-like isoform X2 n=1 Tax=Halictus rubicundus TaxID=77578 RepID=UPI0040358311